MKDKLRKYIEENYERPIIRKVKYQAKKSLENFDAMCCETGAAYMDINTYIKQKDKYNDFQTMLFKLIDERNLKDSDVYNKVHIDRRLFSKIRNDNTYHPSKETIILLGLSLELNEEEIENLLDSAAYSLPKNNYYDLIIRFCFINKIYKISKVNDLLEEYNCKLFNY